MGENLVEIRLNRKEREENQGDEQREKNTIVDPLRSTNVRRGMEEDIEIDHRNEIEPQSIGEVQGEVVNDVETGETRRQKSEKVSEEEKGLRQREKHQQADHQADQRHGQKKHIDLQT